MLEDLLVATFIFELVSDEDVGMKNGVWRDELCVGRLQRGFSTTTCSVRQYMLVVLPASLAARLQGHRDTILHSEGSVQLMRES